MKKFAPGMKANTGTGPRFSLIDIGLKDSVAVMEGETAFWSIVPATQIPATLGDSELSRLHGDRAADLEREMDALRFQGSPSAVYFNATDRCNLNCRYCYLPEEMRRDGERMGLDDIMKALAVLKEHFTATLPAGARPQFVFHGSEPLLEKESIFAAIDAFGDYFRFGVQTNGVLLDRETVDFLTGRGVSIGISVDAHNAEVADTVRQTWNEKGAFDKALTALRLLAGYPALSVICTVTQANVGFLTEIVDFFFKENVTTAMLNPVRCTQRGGRDLKPDNAVLALEFTRALDRTFELFEATGRKMVIANFANVLAGIVGPTTRQLMCDISPCGGGRCFFAVSASGDLFPCSEFIGLSEFKGGNLFQDKVGDVLESPPFKRITGRRIESFEPCAGCAIRHFCGAPCPAEVFAATGELNAPSPYCEFYEEQVRYALRVIAARREAAYLWDDWDESTEEVFSLK